MAHPQMKASPSRWGLLVSPAPSAHPRVANGTLPRLHAPCSRWEPAIGADREGRSSCVRGIDAGRWRARVNCCGGTHDYREDQPAGRRSEEHTSELQSRGHLVCRLLLEKKKQNK